MKNTNYETDMNDDTLPPAPAGTPSILRRQLAGLPLSPEQQAQQAREKRQRLDAEQADRYREIMAESNAPKRHLQASTLKRAGQWEKNRKYLSGKLGSGFLMVLTGTRGNGKTQMGVELMKQAASLEKPRWSLFCTAMGFFMDIKAGYKDTGPSEAAIVEKYSRPPLLVIDEIGLRSESEWENRLLQELLNRRYNDMRDTLLISNQSIEQVKASLGDSLMSRMQETGGVIQCDWASFREQKP